MVRAVMTSALTSPLLLQAGFRHAFFTRAGGVSEGPFESLNFAWSTGDDETRVRENLRLAAEDLGVLPTHLYFLSQVHGVACHAVTAAEDREEVVKIEGDAIASVDTTVAVGVRVADCVPILIGDAGSGAALAIHSGWRGTVRDITGVAVRHLRQLIGGDGELIAAVGPHISKDAFEVGPEVAAEAEEASPVDGVVDRSRKNPHVDLRRMVDGELRRAGITHIDHVAGCTFLEPSRFYSYRRDGAKSGRHLAAIVPRASRLATETPMSDRPLLSLVMIVKNEARSIEKTIESVKPFVDRWLVLDTGSTDGTQDLVKKAFEGVEGRLEEAPFVDFGTTRNKALELAGNETVFTLMLSGDETVNGGEALRKFCEEHAASTSPQHGAYYVRIHFGATHYDSARLARTDAGWRYVGATHEVLTKEKTPPPSTRVPDVNVVHDLTHRDDRSQRARWNLDLRLLNEEQRQRPNDTRTQFYIAQTLECLGEQKRAFAAYERRVKMGGWKEEVYESLFRMARTSQAGAQPWADVQLRYLTAHAHSPERAEPLFAIAWHWYDKKSWPLTFLFAQRGAQIPVPEKATLFVDDDVYRYKLLDLVGTSAYYVGAFEEGVAALTKALAALEGDPALDSERKRLEKNLAFYDTKKKR